MNRKAEKVALFILLVTLGATGLLIIAFFILSFSTIEATPCSSALCKEVTAYLRGLEDTSVNPCDDFYAHMCSRWKHADPPSSFLADARKNFTDQAIGVLSKGDTKDKALKFVSVFYRSCRHFLDREVGLDEATAHLLEVLKLNVTRMIEANDTIVLFDSIVAIAFRSQLPTLLDIKVQASHGPIVHIKYGHSFRQQLNSPDDAHYRTFIGLLLQAVYDGGIYKDAITLQILALDASVYKKLSTINVSTLVLDLRDFSTHCTVLSPDVWMNALNQNLPLDFHVNVSSVIFTIGIREACDALRHVMEVPNEIRVMYFIAHAAIHILKYNFWKRYRRAQASALCFQLVRETFAPVWGTLLARMFAPNSNAIDAFYSTVVKKITYMIGLDVKMDSSSRGAVIDLLHQVRAEHFGYRFRVDLQCTRLNLTRALIPEDFINNFAVIHRDTAVAPEACEDFLATSSPAEYLRLQKYSLLRYVHSTNTVLLPTGLTIPPVYYTTNAVENYIDLATLGTLIAVELLTMLRDRHSSLFVMKDGSNSTERHVLQCYKEQLHPFMSNSEKQIPLQEISRLVSIVLPALKGVHSSGFAVLRNKDTVHLEDRKDRLFFKRFCLLSCAATALSDPQNGSWVASKYSCILPIMNMPQFGMAFKCNQSDRMWMKSKCE